MASHVYEYSHTTIDAQIATATKNTIGKIKPAQYACSEYENDAACIQAAIDAASPGEELIILEGVYNIPSQISSSGKSLTLIGRGNVVFNISSPVGVNNGLCFEGIIITSNLSVASDATIGTPTVTVSNGSSIQVGDIIKIWKNIQWCPLDYSDQMTGEMYKVKSVAGNVITLSENLYRSYPVSDGSYINVYRPIEIHIKNIKIVQSDATGEYEGISIRYSVDSSVSKCDIQNAGFAGVSFYSSYNVKILDNIITNCIKTGSGYGVGIWSGTAHADISLNNISNCRHCVTLNTDERNSLVRDVDIHNNIMTAATITTSYCVDSHNMAIDVHIHDNHMYLPNGAMSAFWDGTLNSVFENNKIYGGYGAVERRGSINNGIRIIKNNYLEGSVNSRLYRAGYYSTGEHLEISDNSQIGGSYGIQFESNTNRTESFKNLVIKNNTLCNLTYDGISIVLNGDDGNIVIDGNIIYEANNNGISIIANSHTTDSVCVSNNNIIDFNYAYHYFSGILITDILYAVLENNKIYDNYSYPGQAIKTDGTSDYTTSTLNKAKGMTGTKYSISGTHNQEINNT